MGAEYSIGIKVGRGWNIMVACVATCNGFMSNRATAIVLHIGSGIIDSTVVRFGFGGRTDAKSDPQ